MKTAITRKSNINSRLMLKILFGMGWVSGIVIAGASTIFEIPFAIQVFVCLLGISVFILSNVALFLTVEDSNEQIN